MLSFQNYLEMLEGQQISTVVSESAQSFPLTLPDIMDLLSGSPRALVLFSQCKIIALFGLLAPPDLVLDR